MTSIEKTAKTVEEAVQLALDELGLPRERVEVEVLEESRSLFGLLGSTQARVRVTAQLTLGEHAAHILGDMLSHIGVEAVPKVVEEDEAQVVINIEGRELGLLIGKHGQTLAALQHLLGLMVNRGQENRKRVILDAEGYRARREESLRHLALASARSAKLSGESVTLEPLLPHERRIIHTALSDDPDVTTHSIGEEPSRRIVIEPRPGREQPASHRGGSRPRDRGRPRGRGYARRAPQTPAARPSEPQVDEEPEEPERLPEEEGDREVEEHLE